MSKLFEELKRRKVVRVAGVYTVTAWILIQVANNIFPAFDFPRWTYQFVILLLLTGFPVALVLAWAYELTPEGLKKSAVGDAPIAVNTQKKRNFFIVASLSMVLVFIFVGWAFLQDSLPVDSMPDETTASTLLPQTISEKSIAVLPFDDFNVGGEEAYFANGLTDEIINALAKTPDLLVASRSSSIEFKDRTANIRDVAQALGVAHILEGSVRQSTERLRVTAQLIRASDGFNLWSENYDSQPDDIIAVQEDIAFQIATALKTAMDPEALRAMVQSGTRSVPAFNAYLKGLSAEIKQGYDFFEQARHLDPDFAVAHYQAARYWRDQLTPTVIIFERETLEPMQMLSLYGERISRAIETAAIPVRYLYQADQALMNLQLRTSLSLLQQYLQSQANGTLNESLLERTMQLAARIRDTDLAWQALINLQAASLSNSTAARDIINGFRSIRAYEAGYPLALEAIRKFPNDEQVLYQAHDLLLWGGYRDDARNAAEQITGTNLHRRSVLLVQIRQACADGDSRTANQLYEEELKGMSNAGTNFAALHALGRGDEANEQLRILDQEGSLFSLYSYTNFPFFDPEQYPNLQRVLERERVTLPAAVPVPYACQPTP
ncbi:MAG: hypothetical protein Q8L06_07650 [Pseudohongiella sp.]|nr:hypothetical protein [Pseudohongiella sp.]